jgi:hypothetical protein
MLWPEVTMDTAAVRATIYFEPELHKAIRLKAADTHRTLSDIVNEAVRAALREDQEDLAAFEDRVAEPTISYEALLKDLKANGKL